jgi:hypothetical protein
MTPEQQAAAQFLHHHQHAKPSMQVSMVDISALIRAVSESTAASVMQATSQPVFLLHNLL